MKTVVLADFAWVGHHPTHYRFYCEALLRLGCRVVALCPQPRTVRDWSSTWPEDWRQRLEADELHDEVQARRWARKVPFLANAHRFRQVASRLAQWQAKTPERRIDLVFFACVYSGAVPSVAWMEKNFHLPWTALLLDSGPARFGFWRRAFQLRSLDILAAFRAANCVGLCTHDESLGAYLGKRVGKQRIVYVPEIADLTAPREDLPLVARIRAAAKGRPIVGCFGQFARRKGALAFLRTAQACREDDLFFVWAGPFETNSFSARERRWIKHHLSQPHENCLVEFGRIADGEDFNALVAAVRVLFLCYKQFPSPSNLSTKAARFNKLSLVSDGPYCMADNTRKYGLGVLVQNPDDPQECRSALKQLLTAELQPQFAEYLRMNSLDLLDESLREVTGA